MKNCTKNWRILTCVNTFSAAELIADIDRDNSMTLFRALKDKFTLAWIALYHCVRNPLPLEFLPFAPGQTAPNLAQTQYLLECDFDKTVSTAPQFSQHVIGVG